MNTKKKVALNESHLVIINLLIKSTKNYLFTTIFFVVVLPSRIT